MAVLRKEYRIAEFCQNRVGRVTPIDMLILRRCYSNASIEPIIENLTANKKLKTFTTKSVFFFANARTFYYLCTPRNLIIPV